MCKAKRYKKTSNTAIDKCIRNFIANLEFLFDNQVKIVASCCGHGGKYPMTIIVKNKIGEVYDLVSGMKIPRKRNFYKRNKKGFYYIPELQ